MSNISKKRREGSRTKIKAMGDHKEFLKRITKSLYYGQLPLLPCLSLPVTELSCELWSFSQRGRSLRRLHGDTAAAIARSACVSPCALVLAILYLERLNSCNPEYLASTAPVDLFLVSLMVGNKFLQDDGEDDEVICSEWAESAGLNIKQLNKLEKEFLNAIDWNVFVNEKSFEAGLLWLERQVALKQAQQRGFFTYTDLAATCDNALLNEFVKSVSSACMTIVFSYITSLMTLITSTLVISHAWLPVLQYLAVKHAATSLDTHVFMHNVQEDLSPYVNNTLVDNSIEDIHENIIIKDVKCCSKWSKHQENVETKHSWYENNMILDWKSLEPWWSKTSVLNWLYQSSLINPMQRWLEKIKEYADLFEDKTSTSNQHKHYCHEHVKRDKARHCLKQYLNLSKLSSFVASVSDR